MNNDFFFKEKIYLGYLFSSSRKWVFSSSSCVLSRYITSWPFLIVYVTLFPSHREKKKVVPIHISKEWIGISRAFCVEYYYVDYVKELNNKKKERGQPSSSSSVWSAWMSRGVAGKKKKGGIRHGKIVGVPLPTLCPLPLTSRCCV